MKKAIVIIGLALVIAVTVLSGCTTKQAQPIELTNEEIALQYFISEHGDGDYTVDIIKEEEDWISFLVYENDEIVSSFGVDKSYALATINRNS